MKRLLAIMLAGMLILTSCAVKKPDTQDAPGTSAGENAGASGPEDTAPSEGSQGQPETAELKVPPTVRTETLQAVRMAEDGETELAEVSYDSMTLTGEGYEKAAEAVERLLYTGSEQVEQKADKLAEEAQDQYSFCLEDGYYFAPYSVSEHYEITRLDAQVLSVKRSGYDFMGGAHGMFGYDGVTIDLTRGVELELPHLMNDHAGFLEKAKEVIYRELAGREDELYEDYRAYVPDCLESPTWYLNGTGVEIVFNPYEIAPYASGAIEVCISYSEAAPFMKEEYRSLQGGVVAGLRTDGVNALETEPGGDTISIGSRKAGEYMDETVIAVNGEEKLVLENVYVEGAYFLRRPEGRSFLVFSVDWASEDFETFVYELTGGKFEKTDSRGGCIRNKSVNLESLKLWTHMSVFGTRTTEMEYTLTGDGKLAQAGERYEFSERNEWNGLKTARELPVVVDGEETVLPAGTELWIVATDDAGIAWFETKDGSVQGEIHYTRDEFTLLIDDRSEYDYFENLPYSG